MKAVTLTDLEEVRSVQAALAQPTSVLGASSQERGRLRNRMEVLLYGHLDALVANAERGLRAHVLEEALEAIVEADSQEGVPVASLWENGVNEAKAALASWMGAKPEVPGPSV